MVDDTRDVDDLLDENDDLEFDFEQAMAHPSVLKALEKGIIAALPVIELVVFGGAEIATALLAGPQAAQLVAQLVAAVLKAQGPAAAAQVQAHYAGTTGT